MKRYILEPAKERKRLRDQDSKLNAQLDLAGGENKNVLPGKFFKFNSQLYKDLIN